MFSDGGDNLAVYYNNLSVYYVLCVCVSVAAVLLTWVLHFKKVDGEAPPSDEDGAAATGSADRPATTSADDILHTYKSSKKQAMEQLAATLTDEQLEQERLAEQQQLRAILQLIQEQKDKFQVDSLEELEGQLRLYR